MVEFFEKYKKMIIIISLSILGFLYIAWNNNDARGESITISSDIISDEDIKAGQGEEEEKIQKEVDIIKDLEDNECVEQIEKVPIHICGEVTKPDVYYLYETDILKSGIAMAGGFTDEADSSKLNLAMNVEKGSRIYIPKVGEEIDKSDVLYNNSIQESSVQNPKEEQININIATINELTTLSGIGPAIGENIIKYREENGDFDSIEDIKEVSRIGDTTFEKIKDSIYCE